MYTYSGVRGVWAGSLLPSGQVIPVLVGVSDVLPVHLETQFPSGAVYGEHPDGHCIEGGHLGRQ